MQREAGRKRDAKSCSAGAPAWASFRRLGDIFDPALECHWEAEVAWFNAKEAAAAEIWPRPRACRRCWRSSRCNDPLLHADLQHAARQRAPAHHGSDNSSGEDSSDE
uniref:Uncharacterized protein n=1 Tax=Aegilops tauschii TaxID=37682 RepID=M8CH32_AEGTA